MKNLILSVLVAAGFTLCACYATPAKPGAKQEEKPAQPVCDCAEDMPGCKCEHCLQLRAGKDPTVACPCKDK